MRINMESAPIWTRVLSLLALTLLSGPAAAQSISGAVMDEFSNPLRGILVTFLDGANAEIISSARTDFNGAYNSALIPPGRYKVRFSDAFGVGVPGFYVPEFFKAGGFDDYCLGTLVGVVPDSTTAGVNVFMRHSGPREVAVYAGAIKGGVVDGSTGSPLAGIKVQVFDAVDGEVIVEATTDAAGYYSLEFLSPINYLARVRFSDPGSKYFPQFLGAGGRDEFCLATALDFTQGKSGADAYMRPIPGQEAENLLDQVEGLSLPENVVTVLATPLVQAANLLTDDNPSNDEGVCGQLTAFITRVDIQEKRGQLSPTEAADLRESAQALRTTLGCS